MQVANVIHHLTRGGGVVVQALNLAKELQKLGHYISFATLTTEIQDPTIKGIIEDIPVRYSISHISGILSPFLLSRVLSKMTRATNYSIIQAFDPIVAGLASVLTRQTGIDIPIVIRLGTTYVDFFRSKYERPENPSLISVLQSLGKIRTLLPAISSIERITLGQADCIVPNCEYLGNLYHSRVYDKRKIVVIRNGVDANRFSPQGKKYPLSQNQFWILYVGRIENRKGLDVLLRALPNIMRNHPNTKLFIVGRAPNPYYLASLKNLAKVLGIESKVIFNDPVSSEDVPLLMRAADILVFPSTTSGTQVEGLPNVILEGMSSGIPIVATNICGVPEVLVHEKTGILVKPSSVTQLEQGISSLVNSSELRKEIGEQSRMYILDNHTIKKAAQQYAKLYTKISTS